MEKVDKYVHKLLKDSHGKKPKPDEIIKSVIIWKRFSKSIMPQLEKMSYEDLIMIASNLILFTVEFETICARTFRPLTGSQNLAGEIISMYSAKDLPIDEIKAPPTRKARKRISK